LEENKKWIIKNQTLTYQCKIANIYELDCLLPSKNIHNNFFSMEMKDWANVFAIDEDFNVIMVKQHRLGQDIITIEVPAGTLNQDEDPKEAALRELEEETGYTSDEIYLLKDIFVNPAIQKNKCFFYIAFNCKKTKDINLDETEEIDVLKYKLSDILDSRKTGLIENSVTLLSIMLAKDYLLEKKLI